jgi:phytoene dehydrogenase-like protein
VNSPSLDAIVVGAGPNGLAAAIELARAGRSVRVYEAADTIGGGTRSAEVTLPGFVHDICASVHPLSLASPFFLSLDLGRHGLEWVQPDAPVAHALTPGRSVVLERDLAAVGDALGRDAHAWRSSARRATRSSSPGSACPHCCRQRPSHAWPFASPPREPSSPGWPPTRCSGSGSH